ncbi:F0F1 ATP synthase subunit delta [Aquimonas voraii]|uniref:ATP synthase subunit delta n=1 Tax=Aquimonas voraii TaxID=265719 RepID=A0A1G6VQ62_9GAMM|nr:F0F1 ATP synthase subunit delta [Aquimonas voraii]SDD54966.1 ATP synthase F1 subcomplex delta subunit [Aquimonas voraii]
MSSAATLARPYARAAFQVARGQQALPAWSSALAFGAHAAATPAVAALFGHPHVQADALVELLKSPSASEEQSRFLAVLAENGRLSLLPEIAAQFEVLRAEAERVVPVQVRSAAALSEAEIEALKNSLKKRFGAEVSMGFEVDAELIGGAVINAGDIVIDGSVRGKLKRMERALAS